MKKNIIASAKAKVGEFIDKGVSLVDGVVEGAKAGFKSGGVKGLVAGAVAGGAMAVGSVAEAAPDFTALDTEIGTTATAVVGVVGTAILAGFGIFALIWGARKIKSSLAAGA